MIMEPKMAFANRLAGKKEKTKKEMQNDRNKTMKVGKRIEKNGIQYYQK